MVPREAFANSFGDACLYQAGGFSIGLRFIWHLEFPPDIKEKTILYVKSGPEQVCMYWNSWLQYHHQLRSGTYSNLAGTTKGRPPLDSTSRTTLTTIATKTGAAGTSYVYGKK